MGQIVKLVRGQREIGLLRPAASDLVAGSDEVFEEAEPQDGDTFAALDLGYSQATTLVRDAEEASES